MDRLWSPIHAFLAILLLLPPTLHAQVRIDWTRARNAMVDEEILDAGVNNRRVLEAMRKTPRHEFVPPNQRKYSYLDMALPIGNSQTISPPYIVAFMTQALDPQPADRVLEIGTGSGYQAAVLSALVREVYSIEIVPELGRQAEKTLKRLRYQNVFTKVGDGYQGWAEHAPFDKIIVTCSPEQVPSALVEQLKEGGRMVIPVGERYQQTMYLMTKNKGELVRESLLPTLFVPMTGKAEQGRQVLPDSANPTIHNGDFEQLEGDPPTPTAWHYQRQLRIATDNAPSGNNYLVFSNAEPGRASRALQGFAVDGRAIRALQFSFHLRAKQVRPGQDAQQLPALAVTFYDENRATVAHKVVGPWQGTFDWQTSSLRIEVPPRAREAILRLGLFGAVGEFSLDAIEMTPVKR